MLLARGDARLMFFDELKLPFFRASDSSAFLCSFFVLSLLFPCSISAFSLLSPRVSISSLFRLSLGYFSVFAPEKVKFCEVLKTDLFFSFSSVKSKVLQGFQNLSFSVSFFCIATYCN
jgi:hypothetical protein